MLQVILSRRSTRKFTTTKVSDRDIEEILKAAMAAPSAGNSQCWEFFVINKREILDEIPKVHPHAQMLYEAQVAILVCADLTREKYQGRWMLDCSAATQNILLAVHSKGLGAVWVGIYPEESRMKGMIELLNLPENIKPVSLVPIGYPAEHKQVSERFDKNKIHYNKFQK